MGSDPFLVGNLSLTRRSTQGQVRLVKTTKPESRKQSRNALLVVRRLINTKGIHTHTEVDVKSGLLAEVMLEINIGVEGISLRGNPPVVKPPNSNTL